MVKRHIYVLRGGALLSQRKSWLKFGVAGDIVAIPMATVENLYYFQGAKRSMAHDVCNYIKSCPYEQIIDGGFKQENGTIIKVVDAKKISDEIKSYSQIKYSDQRVFQVCLDLKEQYSDYDLILVSQNTPILLQAKLLGIESQDVPDMIYPKEENQYTGKAEIGLEYERLEDLKSSGCIDYPEGEHHLHSNQFVIINGHYLGRYNNKKIHRLYYQNAGTSVKPQNFEQSFFYESLFTPPDVAPLVIAKGVAGTGKTHLALQAGLDQISANSQSNKGYNKIVIGTPIVTLGNEQLGFLPGEADEKVSPYLGGIFDNLFNYILRQNIADNMKGSDAVRDAHNKLRSYFDFHMIEIQPLGYIQGHSFENQYIIIDEAQNVAPENFLDIVTRVGNGSKIVITGDPMQVKSEHNLNSRVNGIVYMMEVWKNSSLAWEIQLDSKKSLRSALCQEAINIM